jgi:Ribbon-helix-helix protein, copG family
VRWLYIGCMASKRVTTIRLDPEDLRALSRARKDGISSSELIRRGLRVVGARYYRTRRQRPTTRLFSSVDTKLGDEAQLFQELDE